MEIYIHSDMLAILGSSKRTEIQRIVPISDCKIAEKKQEAKVMTYTLKRNFWHFLLPYFKINDILIKLDNIGICLGECFEF